MISIKVWFFDIKVTFTSLCSRKRDLKKATTTAIHFGYNHPIATFKCLVPAVITMAWSYRSHRSLRILSVRRLVFSNLAMYKHTITLRFATHCNRYDLQFILRYIHSVVPPTCIIQIQYINRFNWNVPVQWHRPMKMHKRQKRNKCSGNNSGNGDHVQWPWDKSLHWAVIGQVHQFTTVKLETSDFMAEWSKPPHSPVFAPHTASQKRLLSRISDFPPFLCFQMSTPLLADQTRMEIMMLYIRGAFIA